MRLLQYSVKCLNSLAGHVVAVVGAAAGSQLPGFMQHYMQRLGGHVAEAEHNLRGWLEIANKSAIDLSALVDSYLASADPSVVATGHKCAADMVRVDQLRASLLALQDASVWMRPIVFVRHLDPDIADATLAIFSPNIPLDLEGLVYASIGMFLGLVIFLGGKQLCLLPVRHRRSKLAAKTFE
jgi:hypothetical protein